MKNMVLGLDINPNVCYNVNVSKDKWHVAEEARARLFFAF